MTPSGGSPTDMINIQLVRSGTGRRMVYIWACSQCGNVLTTVRLPGIRKLLRLHMDAHATRELGEEALAWASALNPTDLKPRRKGPKAEVSRVEAEALIKAM